MRDDRAGATHELADYCREGNVRCSFDYDLTETVRARSKRCQPPPADPGSLA